MRDAWIEHPRFPSELGGGLVVQHAGSPDMEGITAGILC
jgi:hypothetical protein